MTYFLVGREYMIPISTITVAHAWINKGGWVAEVLIINPGIPQKGVNDNEPAL